MKLRTKIWLLTTLIILLIMGLDVMIGYRNIETNIREHLDREARDIRAFLLATRKIYQKEFIDSEIGLNPKTIRLLPAHALTRISREFSHLTKSGVTFNNVSDRPRNPQNQANPDELSAMQWFRENPEAPERLVQRGVKHNAPEAYHFTSPIWVESHCLKCHGPRENAPPFIAANSDDRSFGYQVRLS